jgi:hypothetical protein
MPASFRQESIIEEKPGTLEKAAQPEKVLREAQWVQAQAVIACLTILWPHDPISYVTEYILHLPR